MSSAVVAAHECGLLQGLAGGERRSEAGWAEALGTDPRGTGVVLDVLVAAGAADRSQAGYAGSEAYRALFERAPGGAPMAFLLWTGVSDLVRTGKPLYDMDGDAAARASAYSGVVAGLAGMFEPAAARLAASVPWEPREVLDVGCGSGVWGLALAQRFSGARVTGLDWAEVLVAFEKRATSLGLADRAAKLPGDMHSVAIPVARYDTIVVANVLRLEASDAAAALVRRLVGALVPGGRLVIVDALAHGTREKDLARTTYGLHLALRTRAGRVHAPEHVAGWLAGAGLGELGAIDLGLEPGAVAAMTGRRAVALAHG